MRWVVIELKKLDKNPREEFQERINQTFGLEYGSHWLVSNFIPTDSKKFEFQNFSSTIRFSIKNKLEIKKTSRDRRIFEKNQLIAYRIYDIMR